MSGKIRMTDKNVKSQSSAGFDSKTARLLAWNVNLLVKNRTRPAWRSRVHDNECPLERDTAQSIRSR